MLQTKERSPEVVEVPSQTTSRDAGNQFLQLDQRIERYNKLKSKTSQLVDEIPKLINNYSGKEYIKVAKTWESLQNCGNWLLFHVGQETGRTRLADARFCRKALLCPFCGFRRSAKATRSLCNQILHLLSWRMDLKLSHVTFTFRNQSDLREMKTHTDNSWRKAMQLRRDALKGRKKSEFSKMISGAASTEIKIGSGSKKWHPHIHVAVLHDQDIDQDQLRREWYEITGDSHQVKVVEYNIFDPIKAVQEITSYALKFSSMSTDKALQAFIVYSGSRLLRTFGKLYGLKQDDFLLEDDPLDEPYKEQMFRFCQDNGYLPSNR